MTDARRHAQLFGELQSINHTVAQLSTIGASLDTIIALLKPALQRIHDLDRVPEPNSATSTLSLLPPPDADEHNTYARLHNGLGEDGDYVLMPLRKPSNRVVSGSPRTLGHLALMIDDVPLETLTRDTARPLPVQRRFCDLLGVNYAIAAHVLATYTMPPTLTAAESRTQRETLREATVRFAVPPTRASQAMIERLNTGARAVNRISRFKLQPLRDVWGLVVPSFPKDLFELFNAVCHADVRFLLREYAQGDEPEGCLRRWVEFVGVPWEGGRWWVVDEGAVGMAE